MRYSMTKKENQIVQAVIDEVFHGLKYYDFTGSTISPYNLAEALKDSGFIEDVFDCNGFDYWWEFNHPNVGWLVMFFNAESFELTLEVRND